MTSTTDPWNDTAVAEADVEPTDDDAFLTTGDGRFTIAFTARRRRVELVTRRMKIGALWNLAERLADIQAAEDADDVELHEANVAARTARDEAGLPPRIGPDGRLIPIVDSRKATEIRRRREERVARFLLEDALPLCTAKGALDGIEVEDLPSWWPSMLGPLNDAWRHLPTLPGSG